MFKWVIKRELNNSSKKSEKIEHVIFLKSGTYYYKIEYYLYEWDFNLIIGTLRNYLQQLLLKLELLSISKILCELLDVITNWKIKQLEKICLSWANTQESRVRVISSI